MKYLIISILILISTLCFSQKRNKQNAIYSTLGIKGAVGASTIQNSNIKLDQNVFYKYGFNSSLGIKTSLSYISTAKINILYGIHFEYLWSRCTIPFTKIQTNSDFYTKKVKLNTGNSIITFRYTNVPHKYMMEAGTQFSHYFFIKQNNYSTDTIFNSFTDNYNFTSNFKNYTSVVLGGGIFIKGILFSLRYTGSINSITNNKSSPVQDGYYNNPQINKNYLQSYSTDAATQLNTIQLSVEYYIPFFKISRDARGKRSISLKPVNTEYYWGNNNPYK